MSIRCAILFVLLASSTSWGADLSTLKGVKIAGDLVSINEKEVVLSVQGKSVATPVEQVLQLDLAPIAGLKDVAYIDVELGDGSLIHCRDIVMKGKEAHLTLFSDQQIRIPLSAVTSILRDAGDEAIRQKWKDLFVGKKLAFDFVAIKVNANTLSPLDGTIGDADANGKKIDFTPKGQGKIATAQTRLHGCYFQRKPADVIPPAVCKVYDLQGGFFIAQKLVATAKELTLTTVGGVQVSLPQSAVARLDFSKGKLTYLSDFELARVKVIESSSVDNRIDHMQRDKNLDGGPIRIKGSTYAKGLALHASTELTFDVDGEYREFRAVVGVDDLVGGNDGPVVLKIEGDGRELRTLTLKRTQAPQPVTVSIKDVQRLRIVVASGDLFDFGRHVDLAEARVSK